ncbi:MAG: hypothetical protein MUF54_04320 [Polyangiaceae bacterium]|nr:hypothetical protein [Polyangiaceae bacterium]
MLAPPLLVSAFLPAGCASDGMAVPANGGNPTDVASSEPMDLLPLHTRGVLRVDVSRLLDSDAAPRILDLLAGKAGDAALRAAFAAITAHAFGVDIGQHMQTAYLVKTTDPADGFILLAKLDQADPTAAWSSKAKTVYKGYDVYADAGSDLEATLIPAGPLVVANSGALRSVLDAHASDAAGGAKESRIGPYLALLDDPSPVAFVLGLPALYAGRPLASDLTLKGAELLSGALDFSGESFSGRVAFHSVNADDYVTLYSEKVGSGEDRTLSVGEPLAAGLPKTIELAIGSTPVDRPPAEVLESRATVKRMVHGMHALDHALGVKQGGNQPWLGFDVGGAPNSIFVNFELREDRIEAFERDELPSGFKLKPIRILDTDEPAYFLVLNMYNSSGGLVSGARAEWSVFVEDPVDGHARFLVVQAAAASFSADSVNLMTQPEPVSHEQVGNAIASYVGVLTGEPPVEEVYWRSSIVWPQVVETRVGFAREFVPANDFIYWGNGVADRALYNATVFNRDAVLISNTDIQFTNNSRWAPYVGPEPKHSYVYLNPLEITVSPWWNLDADYLDVTSEHLQSLVDFFDGFYPSAAQGQANALMKGADHAFTSFTVSNTTPTVHYNFLVHDADAFATKINLPAGHKLAKITILEGETSAEAYVTLRIYEVDGAPEGLRAEWCTYTDDGSGRAHLMVLASATADVAVDPVELIRLPDVVEHDLVGRELRTSVVSRHLRFGATLKLDEGASALPTMDWVEAGDYVCWLNGVCDKLFYDGATLEAPVTRIGSANISTLVTPWDGLIEPDPASVFVREHAQLYARNAWHNVP